MAITRKLRGRFWVEVVLGAAFLILFVLTILNPQWIEAVFGIDPDRGSGALEWAIVAAFGLATLVAGGLAGWEWRKAAAAT